MQRTNIFILINTFCCHASLSGWSQIFGVSHKRLFWVRRADVWAVISWPQTSWTTPLLSDQVILLNWFKSLSRLFFPTRHTLPNKLLISFWLLLLDNPPVLYVAVATHSLDKSDRAPKELSCSSRAKILSPMYADASSSSSNLQDSTTTYFIYFMSQISETQTLTTEKTEFIPRPELWIKSWTFL